MKKLIPEPALDAGSRGTPVAAYRDLHGAALAVCELRERGFDDAAVTVRPEALSGCEDALTPLPEHPRRRWALALGALAGVGITATIGSSGAALVSGVVVAFVTGCAAHGLADLRLRRRRARARRAATMVEADRFEVVCTANSSTAAHILARWWDPAARPAARTRARSSARDSRYRSVT